ncbi:MAG: hypothetical protein L6Q78_08835 [Bacteroidia bacterium]|nr:hypothetical protein [Bacteroidia bacterium]
MNRTQSTLFIAVVMTLSFGFNSCKKEESKSSSSLPDFSACKPTKIISGSEEIRFSYNADGKLSKYEGFEVGGSTPLDGYYYTYSGNKVDYTNKSGREKGTYTLNSSGNATSLDVTYYNSQDPTQATSTTSESYKYNADGNLVERVVRYASASGQSVYTYSYIWADGNQVIETMVSNSGSTSSTTNEYYTDKSNSLNFISQVMEFTGKGSKNLIKLSKETGNGALISKYSYEFDSSGRVKKVIVEDETGETDTTELEMTCP